MASELDTSAMVLATVERLRDAIDAHDIDAMVACFDPEVNSEQPAHPARGFRGSENVRRNWTMIFAGVPDIGAEVIRTAVRDNTAWVDWRWSGSRSDGEPFAMRGVTVQEIEGGRITAVSLFMEPVEIEGDGNSTAIRAATGGGR
jgi:ketosteroid isomerase-like protein